jgi:N-acetylglucosamine-6-sulfatase
MQGSVLALAAGVAATLASAAAPAPAASPPDTPENVIVVMTDDMTTSQLRYMTQTHEFVRVRGVRFIHNFAVQPLCCPSRTTFLTGQYPHNHGARGNTPPLGGYEALPGNTLNMWLQDAGYRTAWLGKFLNGYGARGNPPEEVPPGWDKWAALTGVPSYYDYTLNVNGKLRTFGSAPNDYLTDVLARRAAHTLRNSDEPLFMVVAPYAPHNDASLETAIPAPRHLGALEGEKLPSRKAFRDDLGDKPPWVAEAATDNRGLAVERWQRGSESLLAVDDLVGRLRATLHAENEMRETVFVLTSDNGLMHGEHDLLGKNVPYEPSISVPLLIRGGPFAGDATDSRITGNIDLAPTIVELTGAAPGVTMDGPSLIEPTSRQQLLIEGGKGEARPPAWTGLRTPNELYVEYVTGDVELYDLVADPEQLTNVAGEPAYAALEAQLAAELAAVRDCVGAECP